MDLISQLELAKQESTADDRLIHYQSIIEEALRNKQEQVVKEAAYLILNHYKDAQMHDEVIAYAKQLIQRKYIEDYQTLIKISDQWIQAALKSEDYLEMEEAIAFKEQYLGHFPKEQTMQAFYRAVAYEGQKKYSLAIESLLLVPDTLSNANLTSKYLKLTMLYVKTKNTSLAKEAFQFALLYDPQCKNEIFDLARCDLFASSGEYLDALHSFEAFFVKTNQKLRYLDRYIDINCELSRFDEALRFAKEYEPKMAQSFSKNYRIQFYEAIIRLAKLIKDHDLLQHAQHQFEQISLRTIEQKSIDEVLHLWAENKTIYEKERDIALDIFRLLSSFFPHVRFDWIESIGSGFAVYHFSKDRLYEKKISNNDFIQCCVQMHGETLVVHHLDYPSLHDYWNEETILLDSNYALIKPIHYESGNIGFFVAIANKDTVYDTLLSTFSRAKSLFALKLHHHRIMKQLRTSKNQLMDVLTKQTILSIRISAGYVFFETTLSRDELGFFADIVSFETFQSRFRMSNTVYLDELMHGKIAKLIMMDGKNHLHFYQVYSYTQEDSIHLYLIEQKAKEDYSVETDSTRPFTHVKELLNEVKPPISIILIYKGAFSHLPFLFQQQLQLRFEEFIRKAIGAYHSTSVTLFSGFRAEIVKSTDKRVLTRMVRQIQEWWNDECLQNAPTYSNQTLQFAIIPLIKEKNIDVLSEAIEVLLLRPWNDFFVFLDKDSLETLARSSAQSTRVEEWMKSNRLPISYQAFFETNTKRYCYYQLSIHDGLEKEEILPITIKRYLLQEKLDQALWKKALKEIELFYKQTKKDISFCIPLSVESFSRSTNSRLFVSEVKRKKIPLDHLVLLFDLRDQEINPIFIEECHYAQEKGFRIEFKVDSSISLRYIHSFSTKYRFRVEDEVSFSFLKEHLYSLTLPNPEWILTQQVNTSKESMYVILKEEIHDSVEQLISYHLSRMEKK
ncbi:MAG: hypothetical protein Q8M70_05460 [bacterium]|nr:hypothetical protein [bacterium]